MSFSPINLARAGTRGNTSVEVDQNLVDLNLVALFHSVALIEILCYAGAHYARITDDEEAAGSHMLVEDSKRRTKLACDCRYLKGVQDLPLITHGSCSHVLQLWSLLGAWVQLHSLHEHLLLHRP